MLATMCDPQYKSLKWCSKQPIARKMESVLKIAIYNLARQMHDENAQVCSQIENTDFCVNIYFLCTCNCMISQEQKDKPAPAEEEPLEALPSEDAVASGGLAARLARRISAAPSRHIVRPNIDMFQRRIKSEIQLRLDGDTRIWRWEIWTLPAEDSFGIITFHGGIFTSLSFLQSLFSPVDF